MGKGRPSKSGKRTASGRLSRAGQAILRDYGNVKVQQRHALFRHFIDDKGLVFEGTSAGRLWIVGGFDGYDLDPQVMRDSLLDYGKAYWGEYPSTAAVANYTQENRRGQVGGHYSDPDPRGDRFKAMDDMLRDCGRDVRQAVHEIAVEPHWFPDEDKSWVAAIINSRILDRRASIALLGKPVPVELVVNGELARGADREKLRLACCGALALAGGTRQRRAA